MTVTQHFNEKESAIINEFRDRVSDIIENEYEKTEAYLSKWLISANFNLDSAERLLRSHKKWRKENNIEGILVEDMSEIYSKFPITLDGVDREGRPIMSLKAGGWDLKKFLDQGGRDRILRYNIMKFEQATVESRRQHSKTGGAVHQFIGIVDMEGVLFRQLTSTAIISASIELAKTLEANYPGTSKRIYVINAPKIAKVLIGAIKPFLSTDSASRLKVFESNKTEWRKALLEHIEPSQIPQFFGTQITQSS